MSFYFITWKCPYIFILLLKGTLLVSIKGKVNILQDGLPYDRVWSLEKIHEGGIWFAALFG